MRQLEIGNRRWAVVSCMGRAPGGGDPLVHSFNRSGVARTQDHLMQADGLGPCGKNGKSTKPKKIKGSGKWKKWTPEAVLKSANANPLISGRNSGPEGAGHTAAGHTRLINV